MLVRDSLRRIIQGWRVVETRVRVCKRSRRGLRCLARDGGDSRNDRGPDQAGLMSSVSRLLNTWVRDLHGDANRSVENISKSAVKVSNVLTPKQAVSACNHASRYGAQYLMHMPICHAHWRHIILNLASCFSLSCREMLLTGP